MDHQDLRELTGAYALGVLSDDERRALEAHLPTCAECAREVRELREGALALAYAVEQKTPPAALRQRVLDAVSREARAPSGLPVRPHRGSTLLPFWAAAASLAAVALGIYAITLRNRIDALEDRVRAAEASTAGVQQQLASLQAEYDAARRSASILAAGDVRRIDLEGKTAGLGATARAFWSPSRGLLFAATGLPPLPAGRVYQLWIVGEAAPVSAGLMTPDQSGLATAVAAPPAGLGRVLAIAVTQEPAGGVPAPTSPPLLVGSL